MFEYHILLGLLSLVIGVISYIPYFRDIYRGTTKPHPFSWFIWGVLDTTVFIAQVVKGAGAGAWVTGFTTLVTFFITILALKKGERKIVPLDWWCLGGGITGIVLWIFMHDPLYAVLLATVTNIVAMVPTVRKSYVRPHEETPSFYGLNIFKWIPAIFALENFTLTTWLFPVSLVIANGALVVILLVRRKQLRPNS